MRGGFAKYTLGIYTICVWCLQGIACLQARDVEKREIGERRELFLYALKNACGRELLDVVSF